MERKLGYPLIPFFFYSIYKLMQYVGPFDWSYFVLLCQWAHFPHIHFGLMPDQMVKKTNVRQQVTYARS
jgi:hypothetical protein